jgi:phosphoribosylformimino-5-aminoimidazole carboxamide ribotide isomerase
MLLIPSIDLLDGRCVRLLRGDFAAETRYEPEPGQLLQRYRSIGASWLHIVDLDRARDETHSNRALVTRLAGEAGIRLQIGGGIRRASDVADLIEQGVGRVVVGSAAIEKPDEVRSWLRHHGPERICLAFDVRQDHQGVPWIYTQGWRKATDVTLWDAIEHFLADGLRHVLCTDIERDGTLAGSNLELHAEAIQRYPGIAWQASGGVAGVADLAALASIGAAAAISGKALLEDRMTLEELQPFLPGA